MKCETIKKKLERYIDGELNPADRKQVAEHLASCKECTAELERLQSLQSAGEGDFIPEPPPGYWNQLSEDIRSTIAGLEPKKKKATDRFAAIRRWIWPEKIAYRFIGIAATAVLVFFIVRTVQMQRSQIPFFRGSEAEDKKEHIIDGVALPAAEEREREDKTFTEDAEPSIAAVPEPETAKEIRSATVTKARTTAEPPTRPEAEKAAQIGAVAEKEKGIEVPLDEVVVVTQPDKKTEQVIQEPPVVQLAPREKTAERIVTDAKSEKAGFRYKETGMKTISEAELNSMIRKAVLGGSYDGKAKKVETAPKDSIQVMNQLYQMVQNRQSDDHILEILEKNIETEKDPSLREAMVLLTADIHFIRANRTQVMIQIKRALDFYNEYKKVLENYMDYNRRVIYLEDTLNKSE